MDKNKNTIVRRFATPPSFMIGTFELQPNETKFFTSKALRPLSNIKADRTSEEKSFEDTLAGIVKGDITANSIVSSTEHSFTIKKNSTPLFNSNEEEKEQDELCMDERS